MKQQGWDSVTLLYMKHYLHTPETDNCYEKLMLNCFAVPLCAFNWVNYEKANAKT